MVTLHDRFREFEVTPPLDLQGDAMWRLPAYRIATFLAVICREDAIVLEEAAMTARTIEQLLNSIDSIGAAIAEGYGRSSGRDRARYYEYALGSTREAREWYRRASLSGRIELRERAALLTRAIKILTVAVRDERDAGEKLTRRRRRAAPNKLTRVRAKRARETDH